MARLGWRWPFSCMKDEQSRRQLPEPTEVSTEFEWVKSPGRGCRIWEFCRHVDLIRERCSEPPVTRRTLLRQVLKVMNGRPFSAPLLEIQKLKNIVLGGHKGRLYRTAFGLLRNKEDAEDAVQDGLCQAYISLRSFQGRSSFSTWLTSIVMNSARMTRRKKSRKQEASLEEILENNSQALPNALFCAQPNPETACVAIEISALVEHHFNRFRPTLKTTFRLRTVDGFSGPELSHALGISLNAVKSRLLRARRTLTRRLRRCLKGQERTSRGSGHRGHDR